MKKAAAIGIILVMALSLGACGGKSSGRSSDSGPSGPTETSAQTETDDANADSSATDSAASPADSQTTAAPAAPQTTAAPAAPQADAAGANGTEIAAGTDMTGAAGTNMTDVAGGNMTAVAGANMTSAAGTNTTSAKPSMPVMLDPPSMKTAYKPETEDERYARELTGVYLLTDLEDSQSTETGAKALEMGTEGRPMYMEFFSNGTMRETVFGDPIGGLWDKEYLTIGADRVPYEKNGDHLTVTTENMNLTFTRTTQEELDLLLTSGGSNGGTSAAAGSEDTESEDAAAAGEDANAQNAATAAAGATDMQEYLIQEDLCQMTATGYDFSDPRGFVIHVVCENFSIYNLAFNISEAVVNNVMFEPHVEGEEHWSVEVAPMSSIESDIIFSADRAAEYGITSFDYIDIDLIVRNLDQWIEDPLYQGDKEFYPTGKVTGEGIQTVKRRTESGEQKIAEQSKFNFTILRSEMRDNGDYVLKACIENNSYQNLMFAWDDVYVNGDLLDPFWAAEVLPGTICYEDIVFPADELIQKGVSAVTSVKFTMTVYDSKDWLSYSFYTETSTYKA